MCMHLATASLLFGQLGSDVPLPFLQAWDEGKVNELCTLCTEFREMPKNSVVKISILTQYLKKININTKKSTMNK